MYKSLESLIIAEKEKNLPFWKIVMQEDCVELDISEEEKNLTKGDFCAEHFFDMLKYQSIEQKCYKNEISNLKKQIEDIKCSNSFRVGKLLMFIPGKIKRLILNNKK